MPNLNLIHNAIFTYCLERKCVDNTDHVADSDTNECNLKLIIYKISAIYYNLMKESFFTADI